MFQPAKVEDLKAGETVRVTFVAKVAMGGVGVDLVLELARGGETPHPMKAGAIAHLLTFEREIEPLVAGDTAFTPNGDSVHIRMVDGEECWVRHDDGTHATHAMHELRRA